jgi:hypothetical protein
MSWLEIAALVVLLLGVGAGGFLVAQRPAFWAGLAGVLLQKAFPYIAAYVMKRNTPEVEQAMADCVRRGGTWDNFNKRCRHDR